MDVILVDGKNLAYRAHHTRPYLSSQGRPTSVISGFTSILLGVARKYPGASFIIVWDGNGKTWRHTLMEEKKKRFRSMVALAASQGVSQTRIEKDLGRSYKGNRGVAHRSEVHEIVHDQIPILRQFLMGLGIWNVQVDGLEADDLIGILSHYLPEKCRVDKVVVYSGDRDFFQLMSDRILIWRPQKGERNPSIVTPKEVQDDFGIRVQDWIKYRALIGDPTDNIPNVRFRVGPKTAQQLLAEGLDASCETFENL